METGSWRPLIPQKLNFPFMLLSVKQVNSVFFSECCGGAVRGCGPMSSHELPWVLPCGWLMSGYSIVDRPHVWEGRKTGRQEDRKTGRQEDRVGTCWHLIISTCPGWPQALYRLHCAYYPALHCTVLHCSALHFMLYYTTVNTTSPHFTLLYSTAHKLTTLH